VEATAAIFQGLIVRAVHNPTWTATHSSAPCDSSYANCSRTIRKPRRHVEPRKSGHLGFLHYQQHTECAFLDLFDRSGKRRVIPRWLWRPAATARRPASQPLFPAPTPVTSCPRARPSLREARLSCRIETAAPGTAERMRVRALLLH
jgi:hypothetical protein